MKIEKLKINKGDDKTIKDDFSLDIKPYTVLIGENNAGKTNLLNAFYNQEVKNINIFFFRATNIELEKSDEASAGKKTSPFYKLLAEILKSEKLNFDEDIIKPINIKLASITNEVNKNLEFVDNKEIVLKVIETLSDDAIIKNLIPLRILDKYWKENKEVKPSEIGQGTQRIIIFALLKYYSEQNQDNKKLNLFMIEEPEVYLHPKLKKEFNDVLFEISQKPNNQVLISTHDPYFVEMNADDKDKKAIVGLCRDKKTGLTEQFDLATIILSNSHNEINYKMFNVCTDSFHNELYGHIQEVEGKHTVKELEKYFITKKLLQSKTWTPETKGVAGNEMPATLQTFIRNKIHHPENKTMQGNKFTSEELRKSIEEMISIL